MKTIRILMLVIVSVLISSCTKDDNIDIGDTDYLIFGHFYGECMGEGCVETFRLTDTKLFEDTNDSYSGNGPFNFIELSNGIFEMVKDLPDYFPEQLLDAEEDTFGCPDCADQGGLFIQISENGIVQSWRIDQSKSSVPKYLHDFMDKVNEKITLINN